jgi:ABC-type bacteriocin/lantibiotic exporter with double-glycine peptidase domain
MVLAHYGQLRTEEEVRQLLDTGPHGTRARAILQIATLGFHVQIGRSSLAELTTALRDGVPPIVFMETTLLDYWKQRCDHVAVVVGLAEANVSLNDPYFDRAPQQTSLASFRQAWASNDCWAAFIRPHAAGP